MASRKGHTHILAPMEELRSAPGDKLAALRALHVKLERDILREALEASDWNLARAATWLGVLNKSTVQAAVARHPDLLAEYHEKGPPDRRRG